MLEKIQTSIDFLTSYAEWLLLFFVIGGGLYLIVKSRGLPYRFFRHSLGILSGKHDHPEDVGEVNHLQALSSAVAATVGMGNISGVAIAIFNGGPGVVFWMWLTALIGMCIKFYSCSLAVMFRQETAEGKFAGGPMYYIVQGIGKKAKPLAVWFCVAGLVGVLPIFTVNQFTETFMSVIKPDKLLGISIFQSRIVLGLVLSGATALVIFGGLKKIAAVSVKMVPSMVILYFLSAIIILSTHAQNILPSFGQIFTEAFNFSSMVQGGFWGMVILGVRRAVFSNESGVGTAPMFHGQSKAHLPVQEGLVAMLGPFIDTILVCTFTALIILTTGAHLDGEKNGILMTLHAFDRSLGISGQVIMMILVASFALSTLFTYSYYGTKCLSFLRNKNSDTFYNLFYIGSITFAAIASVSLVVGLIDLAFALMCIPNMIAVVYLSPKVTEALKAYKVNTKI
ncbi:MAG: alanine/glycine:cation symporter family protein [Flavobacteriaceae bacterium]|nr:alanine/glycine:cation symporter family protein [Flavobacteriaceae bacterium]